jgi:hypothetical protein
MKLQGKPFQPPEIVPIENPQPGFFCPLTGILMRDPVILEESAISYERSAIEWSLHVDPRRCPLSGMVLKSGNMEPDLDLRKRIISWATANQPDLLVCSSFYVTLTGFKAAMWRSQCYACNSPRTVPLAWQVGLPSEKKSALNER